MEEKSMNEETMVTIEENGNTEIVDVNDEAKVSGNGILGKLAIGAVIVGGAAALIYRKNRSKFEERKIEKLRKKGYVVYKQDEMVAEEVDEPEVEVEADEVE